MGAILARHRYGIAFRIEWHASVKHRTTLGLRFDRECSLQKFQPLFNSDQTEALARPGCFEVKAGAGVADRKMNLIRRSPQLHFELLDAAVLHRVVQRFLQNSEEANRNVWRDK